MRFVVVDVETANPRFSSICQIGLVQFDGGQEIASELTYVDPEDHFDPINSKIHGITATSVSGARTFPELRDWLGEWVGGQYVVSHSSFDRTAFSQAFARHGVAPVECRWIDSAAVARRTWAQFSHRGYGLKSLADHFGISFVHHNALHDARTAGQILLRAFAESGLGLEHFSLGARILVQAARASLSVRRAGDGDGALFGETIVFTGELTIDRAGAADRAAAAGGNVDPGVTKRTTMLVVGERDILPGWAAKSGKHRKAEVLISQGQAIRIVSEADFLALADETA